eukprot:4390771-Prymnesium_polylepis.1
MRTMRTAKAARRRQTIERDPKRAVIRAALGDLLAAEAKKKSLIFRKIYQWPMADDVARGRCRAIRGPAVPLAR